MALLETVDQISEAMDNKKTTVGVFIDLSKAFDTRELWFEGLSTKMVYQLPGEHAAVCIFE